MPVPKRKRSRTRRDTRFANKGIDIKAFTYCKTCVEPTPIAPHQACLTCGFYKGSKVLETKAERGSRRQEKQAVQAQRASSDAAQEPQA
jgi:ribosomal protein L32